MRDGETEARRRDPDKCDNLSRPRVNDLLFTRVMYLSVVREKHAPVSKVTRDKKVNRKDLAKTSIKRENVVVWRNKWPSGNDKTEK